MTDKIINYDKIHNLFVYKPKFMTFFNLNLIIIKND